MTKLSLSKNMTEGKGSAPKLGENASFIELRNVSKTYEVAGKDFKALGNIDLKVEQGEFVGIVGKSGSGKSTLVNMITGLDRPTGGEIIVAGKAVQNLSETDMAVWRGKTIGVIFQFFQLLPTLSILENVLLPMDFCNTYPLSQRKPRALALLEQVGIVEQANKLPHNLSGGQQQRAAIARALANDPAIIVADEPTGNLDSRTAELVFDLFSQLVQSGKTLLMVTHERDISQRLSRTLTLIDGAIVKDEAGTAVTLQQEAAYD